MAKPKLHLDADASYNALQKTLQERGHDVTRTPCEWMPLDASALPEMYAYRMMQEYGMEL